MEGYYATWKKDASKSKGMEEFFKAAGFPEAFITEFRDRELMTTYSGDATKLCLKFWAANRPKLPEKYYEFPIGKEIEVAGLDGEVYMATVNWDGSKFYETYRDKGGAFEFSMIREKRGDEIAFISKLKGKDVEWIEIYNRC